MAMARDSTLAEASRIMLDFAERTGLSDRSREPQRYLWTDAHAVCNFLTLHRATGNNEYRRLAVALIDQVHAVLGRYRADDSRQGWISGLDEHQARHHPTAGGLRIGKPLPERRPQDPFDERLEWDRDGQYFHYLTKWMHALCRAAGVTGEARYGRWAVELAKAAHAAFAVPVPPRGEKRLLWKMSIDLSRPLVPSSGLHDPLDGYITCSELGLCAGRRADELPGLSLENEVADTGAMVRGQRWETEDPLGIGGILFDLCRLFQLADAGSLNDPQLSAALLQAALLSLHAFQAGRTLDDPVSYRLAFRELGLAIGLRGVPGMCAIARRNPALFPGDMRRDLERLQQAVAMAERIENLWRQPESRQVRAWSDHREINSVMLATSLQPAEFLSVT
jgi:hypothetical protein